MTNRARYPRESVAGFRAKGSPLPLSLPRPSTPPLPPSSSSLLSSEQRGWRGWQIDPSRSASTITPIRHYVPPGHTYPHALNVGVRYPNASTLDVRGTLSYDTGADLPVASEAVSNKYPNLRLVPSLTSSSPLGRGSSILFDEDRSANERIYCSLNRICYCVSRERISNYDFD